MSEQNKLDAKEYTHELDWEYFETQSQVPFKELIAGAFLAGRAGTVPESEVERLKSELKIQDDLSVNTVRKAYTEGHRQGALDQKSSAYCDVHGDPKDVCEDRRIERRLAEAVRAARIEERERHEPVVRAIMEIAGNSIGCTACSCRCDRYARKALDTFHLNPKEGGGE